MKTLLVFAKRARAMQTEDVKKITEFLHTYPCKIYIDIPDIKDAEYVENPECVIDSADVLVVLGGDGSLIGVARKFASYNKPILGINLGRLGYLVELEKHDIEALKCLFDENYRIEERIMLKATVTRDGKEVFSTHALNDAVIAKGTVSRMIHITVSADEQFVSQYDADGLVVATPTGSTAYSMSAGGTVVAPELNVLLLTPICPHTFSAKPVIVSDKQIIKVEARAVNQSSAVLTADGQESFVLEEGDVVTLKKSKYTTKLIRLSERNFFHILKHKLEENR